MKKVINDVAKTVNLPENIVINVYKEYWKFIKDTIEKLPLKDDLSEEEFSKLKTNFNLPYLGKLSCTYESWLKRKTKFNRTYNGNKYKESKTYV